MGNKNLTIVLKDREHKVCSIANGRISQGQGRTAFHLLKEEGAVIEQSLSKCQWIIDEQIEQRRRKYMRLAM